MSYLVRKADNFLLEWKSNSDRYPLIIKGARQVGKTETIRKFAQANYKNVIEINFITEPVYKSIIEEGFSTDSITKLISRIDPSKHFSAGDTLIFFDEIQDFPEIATSLKFFKEDGRFDVICSGSLLGVQYHRIASISVGYKIDYQMYSMDFEEFLWAKGYSEDTMNDMTSHMLTQTPFSSTEHNIFSNLFIEYCILGGMPAIVSNYISKGTFEGSLDLQRQLLIDYENDIIKYAEGLDKAKILSVYRSIPAQLAKENKKFQYSLIQKKATAKSFVGSLQWIEDAGIIRRCYNLDITGLPLEGNAKSDSFKVYTADIGIFVSMLEDDTQFDILNGNLSAYKGAIYENLMADILGKMGKKLYYFHKDSGLEVDFVLKYKRKCTIVEVKAKGGKTKSAKTILNHPEKYGVEQCLKFGDYNIGRSEETSKVLTLPFYIAFLLYAEP